MPGVDNAPYFLVRCSVCGGAIGDGEGYLEVDQHAAIAAERASLQERSERLLMGVALKPGAADIPWRALHGRCDPQPDSCTYWFDVARIRIWQTLMDWTLHLHGKSWVAFTNWDDLVRAVLAKNEIAPVWAMADEG